MNEIEIEPTTLIIYWNKEDKALWTPRIKRIRKTYNQAEADTVLQGMRRVYVYHVNSERFDESYKFLRENNLVFFPTNKSGVYQGFCLSGDTDVYLNPSFKKLEELQRGDRLAGTTVLDINKEFSNKIIKIKPQLLDEVKMTPNHKVLIGVQNGRGGKRRKIIQTGWKLAKDIRIGNDCVVVPKTSHDVEEIIIDFEKYSKINRFHFPTKIKYDEDLAYLFGWFLAEGYAHTWRHKRKNGYEQERSIVSFHLGQDEETIAKKIKAILNKKFNLSVRIRENNKGRKDFRVDTESNVLARFLIATLGGTSKTKRLPEFVFKSNKKLIGVLLQSYFQGDGCITKDKGRAGASLRQRVDSVSKQLIKQLQMLLLQNGRMAVFQQIRGVGGFNPGGFLYRLSFSIDPPKKKYYVEDEKNFYFPIRKIEEETGSFVVYDLETDKGTYQVPFIVHNSNKHRPVVKGKPYTLYGGAVKSDDLEAGRLFEEYSLSKPVNHTGIGRELLGYMECCTKFFETNWNKTSIDPMYEAAIVTDGAKITNRVATVKVHPYCNNMLRYFGIRITPHLTCSFNCKKTIKWGKKWFKVMSEIDKEAAVWAKELLSMPLTWSCYKGVVIIDTPLFRGISNSDGVLEKKTVVNIGWR